MPAPIVNVVLPERSVAATWVKRVVQGLVGLAVLPRLIAFWVARRLIGSRALTSSAESIARVPGMRGVYLRQAFYRRVLAACGRNVYFGWQSVFSMSEARVGERAYIGRYCSIGFAHIGEDVMLADGVQILSGGHEHDSRLKDLPINHQGHTYVQVNIGRGAWLGAGSIIMAHVGEDAIVGAGAVVNRPIPAGAVAVGIPAKVVKYREGWEPVDR